LKDRNTRYETPIGPSGVPITAVVVLLCDECAIKEYIPLAYEVRRIKQFSNKKQRDVVLGGVCTKHRPPKSVLLKFFSNYRKMLLRQATVQAFPVTLWKVAPPFVVLKLFNLQMSFASMVTATLGQRRLSGQPRCCPYWCPLAHRS
jgi:hypothetical protein